MKSTLITFFTIMVYFIIFFSCRNTDHPKELEKKIEQNVDNTEDDTTTIPSSPITSAITDDKKESKTEKNTSNQIPQKTKPSGNQEIQEIKDKDISEQKRPAIKNEPVVSLPEEKKDKGKNTPAETNEKKPVKSDVTLYQSLLSKYVSNTGKVNYAGLKKDVVSLEKYTLSLSEDPGFANGSEKEKLALWINTYNAYTLLMITKNYPVNSIRDLHGGKPWDASWIRIGKKTYSLNQIENDIIRPSFGEARIHFVLNCAAKSCPPLLNQAMTSANLEPLLESATKAFINGQENELQENKIAISSIFDWYREDYGVVISFLNRYSRVKIKPNAKISYKKYDWSLND